MTNIHRRDFLNGVTLLGAGGLLSPLTALAVRAEAASYPPALTGLRGAHPGSFETAHDLAWNGIRDFGPVDDPPEEYDLIVIGGGVSGLAAAYHYRRDIRAAARILVLDNHDDFGGHSKRNEFTVDGHPLLSYGGGQSLDNPSDYGDEVHELLRELGIDLDKLSKAYDRTFFRRHGLSSGIYYEAQDFGRSVLLTSALPTSRAGSGEDRQRLPGLQPAPRFVDTLTRAPLGADQRTKLNEVLAVPDKAVAYFAGKVGQMRFREKSYVQFLREVYSIDDPALLKLLSMTPSEEAALGGSGVSLSLALESSLLGLPSARRLAEVLDDDSLLPDDDDGDDYVHHFPDGNAMVARLLAQKLVPGLASVSSPEECLTARFDYGRLDSPDNSVRIRLSSLVVEVDNRTDGVFVRYLRNGKRYEARARHAVMAAWHMMAAHIIPSLPAEQKAAMRANIKMPLVYVQVALRRWDGIAESGVAAAYCPGSYYQFTQMDFPVNFGGYASGRNPDQPTILLMARMPCPPLDEGAVPDLLRAGRAELLATDFATFEGHVRRQLQAMYGPHGFDADRDIAAITVNRWPHGYVYEDAEYDGRPAHVSAGERHGHIVMANADAAGSAYLDAAIDAARRAVQQLKQAG